MLIDNLLGRSAQGPNLSVIGIPAQVGLHRMAEVWEKYR